jgi:hypothetical protein
MAYVSGLVFLAIAFWFVISARRHRAQSLAEAARIRAEYGDQKPVELHPSLSILVDFAPSLTIFSLAILSAGIVIGFLAVGPIAWFSWFDLGAVLTAVAGYGYWMVTKTKFRDPETQRANRAV